MIRLLFLTAVVILFTSATDKNFEKTSNGVLVKLKSTTGKTAKIIRLEVINDQIIRVVAAPTMSISDQKSLCAIERSGSNPVFSVAEVKDKVVISTSKIKATVSLRTGQIIFTDTENKVILKEPSDGGNSFTPVTVEGSKGYTIQQIFESPDDEAFYGLGQHQSDEFNYKGLNEVLYQYNTKVAVPFIVSSRNYGILWDNYSLTRFGDPRDYSDLNIFRLYDNKGNEGGLTATYYDESDTNKIYVQRKESTIDYEDLTTIKKLPEGVPLGKSKVTWKGSIEPGETGLFHFKLYYAGYIKLFINNELIVPETVENSMESKHLQVR